MSALGTVKCSARSCVLDAGHHGPHRPWWEGITQRPAPVVSPAQRVADDLNALEQRLGVRLAVDGTILVICLDRLDDCTVERAADGGRWVAP